MSCGPVVAQHTMSRGMATESKDKKQKEAGGGWGDSNVPFEIAPQWLTSFTRIHLLKIPLPLNIITVPTNWGLGDITDPATAVPHPVSMKNKPQTYGSKGHPATR